MFVQSRLRVTFRAARRSDEQNRLMWQRLTELSEQLPWDGEKLTPEEWKDLITACLRKQKVVRGIEGGLVFLGARTSQMTVAEMNDVLSFMEAFGAERGVTAEAVFQGPIEAPVRAGQKLGELVVTIPGTAGARLPLLAATDVPRAGVLGRMQGAAMRLGRRAIDAAGG